MYYINLLEYKQEFYKTPEQSSLPSSAIELTDEKFNELWAADQAGKIIILENNELVIKEPIDIMTLSEIKTYAISTLPQPIVSEVTLANSLIFDDTEKSLNYLQTKRATSNSSETVYDKYNSSAVMTNAQLTTAVSTLATSIMQKDDAVKAKIVQINNAETIDGVKIIAGLVEDIVIDGGELIP